MRVGVVKEESIVVEERVERSSEDDREAEACPVIDTTWYSAAVWSVSSLKSTEGALC